MDPPLLHFDARAQEPSLQSALSTLSSLSDKHLLLVNTRSSYLPDALASVFGMPSSSAASIHAPSESPSVASSSPGSPRRLSGQSLTASMHVSLASALSEAGVGSGSGVGVGAAKRHVDKTPENVLALPIECLPDTTHALVINEEEIARCEQDATVQGDIPLELVYAKELQRHVVTPEQERRTRAIIVAAMRRHERYVKVADAPRDHLFIVQEMASFTQGDVTPRPGSPAWHLMSWLVATQKVNCVLARAAAGGFSSKTYTYSLVADMTNFLNHATDSVTDALRRERDNLEKRVADAETRCEARAQSLVRTQQRCEQLERKVNESEALLAASEHAASEHALRCASLERELERAHTVNRDTIGLVRDLLLKAGVAASTTVAA